MAFASLAAFASGSSAAVSGYYDFRSVVDTGPTAGLYITGSLELVVTPTTVIGHLCGVSFSPSHCASLSGTNVDGSTITFTVHKLGKSAPLDSDGTFHSDSGQKGGFTGFSGTFAFGPSSGHWTAVLTSTPVVSGNWTLSMLIQRGVDKGQMTHGTLSLTETAGKITGTYCPDTVTPSCSLVKGTNTVGYLNIFIEAPMHIVLRGSFLNPDTAVRADGRFYIPGTNDVGYWLADHS